MITSVDGSQAVQLPGSRPQSLLVTLNCKQVTSLRGLVPLQWYSRRIRQPRPTGWSKNLIKKTKDSDFYCTNIIDYSITSVHLYNFMYSHREKERLCLSVYFHKYTVDCLNGFASCAHAWLCESFWERRHASKCLRVQI